MVTELLLDQWNDLQIAEEDTHSFEVGAEWQGKDDLVPQWCLLGRLLSERPVNFEALRDVMATLWRPVKGLVVKEITANRYLFQFFHELDMQRVEEGTPWTFNRVPLILDRFQLGENPKDKKLNTMALWVQVHGLKLGFFSEFVLKACGNYIGTFLASCPTNFAGGLERVSAFSCAA